MATSLQKVSLNDASTNVNTGVKDMAGQSMLAGGEDTKDISSINIWQIILQRKFAS